MAQSVPERRRAPRVARTVPVRIGHGTEELIAESIDLSASGVYCRVPSRLALMTKVQVSLVLPAGSRGPDPIRITATGAVVRVDAATAPGDSGPPFRVAIFFMDISPDDRDRLLRFVEESRLERLPPQLGPSP